MDTPTATSEIEIGISDVLNGSGLPAAPEPQTADQYGVATETATLVADAISHACEDMLSRMYETVEQNEAMVKDQRRKVDDFAKVIRDYTKAHVGSLSEFMAHLRRTSDNLDTHVRGFEERLKATQYPRVGDD